MHYTLQTPKSFILSLLIAVTLCTLTYPTTTLANSGYSCPIDTHHITGIQQWNDGFPFNAYNRHSHCRKGDCNTFQAVDISAYYNSPVKSPVSGTIVYLNYGSDDYLPSKGYTLGILGDDGLYYKLPHLQEMYNNLQLKSKVINGQLIGRLVSQSEVASVGRICNLGLSDTTTECIKVHLHFEVYKGTGFDQPISYGGRTLSFLSQHCGINRPSPDGPAEFPTLPTINCAKIAANPNITKCFSQAPTPTNTPFPTPTFTPTPTRIPTAKPPTHTPTKTPTPKAYDYDKDGDVDYQDLLLLNKSSNFNIFTYAKFSHAFRK